MRQIRGYKCRKRGTISKNASTNTLQASKMPSKDSVRTKLRMASSSLFPPTGKAGSLFLESKMCREERGGGIRERGKKQIASRQECV